MSEQLELSTAAPPAAPAAPAASPAATREPDTRGHSPARDQREVAAAPAPDKAPAPILIGDAAYTAAELQSLAEFKATEDVRRAALPSSPDGYELKLPDDFKAPAGVEFKFATDDPVLGGVIKQAQAFAHANEWSQAQFSGMMGLYAASQSQEQALIATARAAEVAKLGVNGGPRVDAISRWMKTYFGDEIAAPFMATLATARQVAGWEKIVQSLSSQGGAGFDQRYRAQPDPNKIDGYESMSFEQRRESQDRLSATRSRR